MAKMLAVLVALVYVIAVVSAQSISLSTTNINIDQGMWSDPIFVRASAIPDGYNKATKYSDVTVTIRKLNQAGGNESSPTPVFYQNGAQVDGQVVGTLNYQQGSFSFQVMSQTDGVFVLEVITDDHNDPRFFPANATGAIAVRVNKREFRYDQLPSAPDAGEYSEPVTIYLDEPAASTLTLTLRINAADNDYYNDLLLANDTIKFNPRQLTIPQGKKTVSFTYYATVSAFKYADTYTFAWDVTGDTLGYYPTLFETSVNVDFQQRNIWFPTDALPGGFSVPMGYNANDYFYAYIAQTTNESMTVTPQAADTTFDPPSITFPANSPTGMVQRFKIKTVESAENKRVYYRIDQGQTMTFYQEVDYGTMNVQKRNFNVVFGQGGNLVLFNRTYMSISIPYPTPSGVEVFFEAPHLTFSTPSAKFTGNVTSIVVQVQPNNIGTDNIVFTVTGGDAKYFNDIGDLSITVGSASFFGPGDNINFQPPSSSPQAWYIPTLYIGQTSPKIPIRTSISPITTVTLTPYAPNLRFTPATLTFRNGTEQQWFTITPIYTSSVSSSFSYTVKFFVSGTDHTFFNTPSDLSVTVQRRQIQTFWSPHLTNTFDGSRRTNYRHLGKTYKVWTTVNYIGDKDVVTVTPTSPYFSFNPKVMTFNSKTTRILLDATVTGVSMNGNNGDIARIDYLIGGSEGGWYAPISSETDLYTTIRPLAIEAAVLATDSRQPHNTAGYVDFPDFDLGDLTSYHVLSFRLRSYVLPDGGLTITPKCAHASFSPSKISLDADDAVKRVDHTDHSLLWRYREDFPIRSQNITFNAKPYTFNSTGLYLEANFSVKPSAGGYFLVTFELSGKDANYYQVPRDVGMYFGVVTRDGDEPTQSSAIVALPSVVLVFVAIIAALFM